MNLKRKKLVPLLVLLVLLLGLFLAFAIFRITSVPADTTWYAPLVDISYQNTPSEENGACKKAASFLLEDDGTFTLTCEGSVCSGQFDRQFPDQIKILDPQQNLYSFSFHLPCEASPEHTLCFTFYPMDLNAFTVQIDNGTGEGDLFWMAADNPATLDSEYIS